MHRLLVNLANLLWQPPLLTPLPRHTPPIFKAMAARKGVKEEDLEIDFEKKEVLDDGW